MRMTPVEKSQPEIENQHTDMPKSFLSYLAEQQGGAVADELSIAMRDLIENIEMHFEKFRGKVKGEIVVSLKLTLDRGNYKFEAEYKVKAPQAPKGETIMWLGPDGNLHTNNPKQLTFGLRAMS